MERKTTVLVFQATNSHEKTSIGLRNGNFKRETESLLIAAQKNVIRTNYTKAKIDNMQQNREY